MFSDSFTVALIPCSDSLVTTKASSEARSAAYSTEIQSDATRCHRAISIIR